MSSSTEMYCFIGHLFRERQFVHLRKVIRDVLAPIGIRPLYADDVYELSYLLDKIAPMVKKAVFCIFDLSECSPNVMLELGMALVCKNAHYLLCEAGTQMPADLKGVEVIAYSSMEELFEKLSAKVWPRWTKPESDMPASWLEDYRLAFFEAEDLHHREGKLVEDPKAQNGRAWRFGEGKAQSTLYGGLRFQHAVFGPYHALPGAGLYKAYFCIKASSNRGSGDVLVLDVVSEGNPRPANFKGCRTLRPKDFAAADAYQLFSVPFGYGCETDIEYRVHQIAPGVTFDIDYIAVVDSAAENAAQKSTGVQTV